ncbi:MAG: hypothetical protein V4586_14765 [Pseudomonadota bacterium]
MAVFEETFAIPLRTWVLLTPAAIAAGRLQCQGPYEVHIRANQSGVTAPTDLKGSLLLRPFEGQTADRTVAMTWPGGVAGGTTAFLWAYSLSNSAVSVSYA